MNEARTRTPHPSGMDRLGRRGLFAFGAATLLTACTSATKKPENNNRVRTDRKPLERRFTALGPLTEAHWLGIVLTKDSRGSVPGPTDVRLVGTAKLKAGAAAAIVKVPQRGFRPATPSQIPEVLVGFIPKDAGWVRSTSFDEEATGLDYGGAFYLDPDTDMVYFDARSR